MGGCNFYCLCYYILDLVKMTSLVRQKHLTMGQCSTFNFITFSDLNTIPLTEIKCSHEKKKK